MPKISHDKEDTGSLLIVAALKTGHEAATGSGSLTRIAFRKRGALTDIPIWLDGLKVADDDAVIAVALPHLYVQAGCKSNRPFLFQMPDGP